jgi:hypothetical protein
MVLYWFMVTGVSRALALHSRDPVYREMRGTAERESVTPSYRTPITFFLLPLLFCGYHIHKPRPLALLFIGLSSSIPVFFCCAPGREFLALSGCFGMPYVS